MEGEPGLGEQAGPVRPPDLHEPAVPWPPWPRAVDVLRGVGSIYVVLALWRWRDRFHKPRGSVAASVDTSTFRPSSYRATAGGADCASSPSRMPERDSSLPAPLLLCWSGGVHRPDRRRLGLPTDSYCDASSCTAASATAGVMGLLAASVGAVDVGAGVRLLRRTGWSVPPPKEDVRPNE